VIKIPFFRLVARNFPTLSDDLRKASMLYTSEEFIKKTFISSLYVAFGGTFILFLFVAKIVDIKTLLLVVFFGFIISFIVFFFYFLQLPFVKINRIDKEINKEIVYAGRFLVVELESGVTLYDAMKNLSKSYPVSGAYFREIIDKINIGTSIEDAVKEAIETCPSSSLVKIFWQISNSLRTGSNISLPLKSVVETLIKEQQIAVNEYGRKLNPLAMFYMLIAIIMPTLGVTMLTIVSIFAGIKLNLVILLLIDCLVAFMQFMFVAMVNSIRPPVEL
jgi:flagellar protein FlaJ